MKKFSNFICKHKTLVLIISFILLIPSLIGIYKTKINYDILVYLPSDIETIKGQNILTDDFNIGAFSVSTIKNMNADDVLKMEEKIKKVDGVNEVVSLYDAIGTTIPIEMLPDEITEKVSKSDETLLLITFKDGTSDESTLNAIKEIKSITKGYAKIGGMSAMVLDTMNLSDKEVATYIVIAVILCIIVLTISLDSYLTPILLLLNIGIAILYNMGTNIILGDISYITKAISVVLQLGVTTDFSIFLYHKYENAKKHTKDKNKAMESAINETVTSVIGSSLTTIAGFLALCTMTLTLGKDIGLVMAKGVMFGVICVITIFPCMLLCFDKVIEKTTHKVILPEFNGIKTFIIKHYKVIFVIFLILLIPAWYSQKNTKVYYNLEKTLPDTLESSIANNNLKDKYNIVSTEMILVDKNLSNDEISEMSDEIKKLKGIDFVVSYANFKDIGLPLDMIDNNIKNMLESDKYKMVIVNSLYENATDELNNQISDLNKIVKKYDSKAIVAGEGPLMKDLVEISDTDFNNVTYASIVIIFVLMLIVLKSVSLPVLLISVIEFAIFINMGIPYFTNQTIPFISSIVIGTIQLGATIDYAILMTTKYLEERKTKDKFSAIRASLDASVNSIIVSGMCFFAATIGVGVYSNLEMIGSLCTLISRGALISMATVIMVLPSVLLIFDKLIYKTTMGFKKGNDKMKNKGKKAKKLAVLLLSLMISIPNVSALTKEETVYAKLKNNGDTKKVIVTEHLINENKDKTLSDLTNLTNISNLNGKEKFKLNNNQIVWETKKGNDIYYEGTTDTKLPVEVEVIYKLDGNVSTPKKMLNKKGKVEIEIKFKNNEKHYINKKYVYTPFTSLLTTTLSTKNNSNISVTNGKVISTGTNNVVAAVAMPGLYESLDINELKNLDTIKISYDTTKFSLGSMYIASSSNLLGMDDTSKLNDVNKIYDSVNTLENAALQIINGANDLNDGSVKLNQGTAKLNEGAKTAYLGTLQIKNAVDNSKESLKNDNSDALDSYTINQIKQGAVSAATLDDNTKKAISESAISKIRENEQYKAVKASYESGLSKLNSVNPIITDEVINKCLVKDESYAQICSDENVASLTNTKQLLVVMESVASQTAVSTADLVAKDTASKVSESVATTVANSVKKAASDKTYEQLNMLSSKLEELSNGLNDLQKGTNELLNGTNELTNGTNELYNGTVSFNNNGILKISNILNNKLKSKTDTLNNLVSLSKEYNSFTMKDKNTKGTTKFIYLIDGLKK